MRIRHETIRIGDETYETQLFAWHHHFFFKRRIGKPTWQFEFGKIMIQREIWGLLPYFQTKAKIQKNGDLKRRKRCMFLKLITLPGQGDLWELCSYRHWPPHHFDNFPQWNMARIAGGTTMCSKHMSIMLVRLHVWPVLVCPGYALFLDPIFYRIWSLLVDKSPKRWGSPQWFDTFIRHHWLNPSVRQFGPVKSTKNG